MNENACDSLDADKTESFASSIFEIIKDKISALKQVLKIAMINTTAQGSGSNTVIEDERIQFIRKEIGIESFCSFMHSFDIPYLATQEAFEIFDINNDGKIELKEFLLVRFDCECMISIFYFITYPIILNRLSYHLINLETILLMLQRSILTCSILMRMDIL